MRYRPLTLCSIACSIIAPAVMGQSMDPSFGPVGIRWNSFKDHRSAMDPVPVALGTVVDAASVGHDLQSIPSPYSYPALGLFCKAEVKLNRLLPFPVMVRLGDVQRAEELDGKGDRLTRP